MEKTRDLQKISRDFISTDTNLLRRLKLAGYEPIYKQTSLDEFNYLISNNGDKSRDFNGNGGYQIYIYDNVIEA